VCVDNRLAAITLDSVVPSTVERCSDKFRCPSTTWTTLKTLLGDVRFKELLGAGVVGSLLDLDHFAAAVSLSLGDATSLGARPKGHAMLFIVLAMVRYIWKTCICVVPVIVYLHLFIIVCIILIYGAVCNFSRIVTDGTIVVEVSIPCHSTGVHESTLASAAGLHQKGDVALPVGYLYPS
jgi:hypothetical protein